MPDYKWSFLKNTKYNTAVLTYVWKYFAGKLVFINDTLWEPLLASSLSSNLKHLPSPGGTSGQGGIGLGVGCVRLSSGLPLSGSCSEAGT